MGVIGVNGIIMLRLDGAWLGDEGVIGDMFRLILLNESFIKIFKIKPNEWTHSGLYDPIVAGIKLSHAMSFKIVQS